MPQVADDLDARASSELRPERPRVVRVERRDAGVAGDDDDVEDGRGRDRRVGAKDDDLDRIGTEEEEEEEEPSPSGRATRCTFAIARGFDGELELDARARVVGGVDPSPPTRRRRLIEAARDAGDGATRRGDGATPTPPRIVV